MFMGIDEAAIKKAGGFNTASEIMQQPRVINELYRNMLAREEEIKGFVKKLGSMYKVILTGAGSSEFIGSAVYYAVKKHHPFVESIGTTSIVASPGLYIQNDMPILLVSFARSGDSPESEACVEMADQISDKMFHLIITCNKGGKLYTRYSNAKNALTLLMPEGTNDKGFAMTSSVTTMLLAAFMSLGGKGFREYESDLGLITKAMDCFLLKDNESLHKLAKRAYGRVVFLGSDSLRATACESALKLMELTNGSVAAIHDTTMGFRHGPKTFINKESEKALIVMLSTNDSYTAKYEVDLLNELKAENRDVFVVGFDSPGYPQDSGEMGYNFTGGDSSGEQPGTKISGTQLTEGFFLSILYLALTQSFAFFVSHYMGYNTDSPVAAGTLNRVVAGVTIYPYK